MQKKVVIAGAGDRLGRELTRGFLSRGWQVFAGYRGGDERPEPTQKLKTFGFEPGDHFYTLAARKKVGEAIDLLIVNIDGQFGDPTATIGDAIDYGALLNAYDHNCVGPLRVIHTFLPLLDQGDGKRICVVTTKDSSNNSCCDIDNYYNRVSRAPLNMALTQLYNGLRPDGYTFRLYCKDTRDGNDRWAIDYFTRARSYEPESLRHSDEERIVLRDWMAREIPW